MDFFGHQTVTGGREKNKKMSTKTPLPTVNEKVTESVSIKGCLSGFFS